MLQCKDCEFFGRNPDGTPRLTCDPFSNIKEPECIAKWQFLELGIVASSHQATLDMYRRLAPLQEQLFKQMEREVNEADEADRWKLTGEDDENDDDLLPQ
ncbi:MAG: hypothetical protein ACYTFA_03185 [Planctomycetota bacterium]|jgi:hypothetical protein